VRRGMRVCLLQFRQVMTMWGSLCCLMRTRELTPGRMKVLQCLQTCLRYWGGRCIRDAIAIFLAWSA
jgi:hypothetical protein